MKKITFIVILLFILVEVIFMLVYGGNVIVDSLIFNNFIDVTTYLPHERLNDDLDIKGDSLFTQIKDSVDYQIYIDDKVIVNDTLFAETPYTLFRQSFWLLPGKHGITISSTRLKSSYTYSFYSFAFLTIFVESPSEKPYFYINRTLYPFQRTML